MRYTRCYAWFVLLHGVESWTLKVNAINKIEAFEMWTYRRLLSIPWTDRVTNEEVLRRMKKQRELLTNIMKRKTYISLETKNIRYFN